MSSSYLLNTPESLSKEKARLLKQAKVLFEVEKESLNKILPESAYKGTIVDLGCGNGAYTGLLGKFIQSKTLVGYERNKDLIAQAEEVTPELKITEGDLTNLEGIGSFLKDRRPDLINLRFVLQHMTVGSRSVLLKNIYSHMKSNSVLLITEPSDNEIIVTPSSTEIDYLINRTIEVQAARGGDRNLGSKLQNELKPIGFKKITLDKCYLDINAMSVDSLVEVIFPIWKTYLPNESREDLDSKIQLAEKWVRKYSSNSELVFKFPLYLYTCEK